MSSSLVFATGHDLEGDTLPDWARLALSGATVAVYMGRSVAAEVAARLIEAGLSPDTPVAVGRERQPRRTKRLFPGTLADLPALAGRGDLTGPVLILIGDAVAEAELTAARRSPPSEAHDGGRIRTTRHEDHASPVQTNADKRKAARRSSPPTG